MHKGNHGNTVLTTKQGPTDTCLHLFISWIHKSVVEWFSAACSGTPHLISTT